MVNLRELIIVYWPTPSILDSCTFRLHKYHDALQTFSTADTTRFLANQHEITEWIGGTPTKTHESNPDSNFLPYLTVTEVCSHSLLRHFSSRRLQRLSVKIWRRGYFGKYADVARTINFLRETLNHLNIQFQLRVTEHKKSEEILIRHLDLPRSQFLTWNSRDVFVYFLTKYTSETHRSIFQYIKFNNFKQAISTIALPQLLILMLSSDFDRLNDTLEIDESSFAAHVFNSRPSLRYVRPPNYLSNGPRKRTDFCKNRDDHLVPLHIRDRLELHEISWRLLPLFENETMLYEALGTKFLSC